MKSKVQLKDGTVLNLRLNGTEYESDVDIADEVVSAENLEEVIIDDVEMGKMVLEAKYKSGNVTRLQLRKQTDMERMYDEMMKISSKADQATTTANEAKEIAQTGNEYTEAGKILLGEEV